MTKNEYRKKLKRLDELMDLKKTDRKESIEMKILASELEVYETIEYLLMLDANQKLKIGIPQIAFEDGTSERFKIFYIRWNYNVGIDDDGNLSILKDDFNWLKKKLKNQHNIQIKKGKDFLTAEDIYYTIFKLSEEE